MGTSWPLRACWILSALCVAARVSAADYHVAQGASCGDTGPGTQDQPWCTVQRAADVMVAGDTVTVHAGVYRESVTPANAGEADKPIRYKAAEGEKVVLTGADAVSGWAVCSAVDCPGVRDPLNVWFADIDYDAPSLFENGVRLERARMPVDDYWVAEGGGQMTLVDTKHLCAACLAGVTQTDNGWVGATLAFWKHDMGIHSFRTVTAFDLASSTLTLDDVIYADWVVEAGVDTWYFENHVALIERPGQWVIADQGQGKRLYLQPAAGGDPNSLLIEASHRSRFIIEYGAKSHLSFEGFELAQGAGHAIGGWSSPYPTDIRILKNRIHDNASTGVYLREATGCLVQDNEIWANEIGLSGGPGSTVDHNRIHHNRIDGLWPGDHALISRNVIAHQNNLNHPDNIQTCCGASEGIVFDGNLILNGGQCFMLEQTSRSVVRNNVILGSGAYCLIFGDSTVNDWAVTNNTFGLTGYGAVRMEGTGYTLRDNIFFTAGTSSAFGAPETGIASDYNLFFAPSTNERGAVNYKGETYGGSLKRPFSEYQALSGQDSHSAEGDPLFANYPTCMAQEDSSTTDTVTTMDNEDCFAVGDHIEIDFDRVVRTVESKAVDDATHGAVMTFSPALERRIWHGFLVLNWKAGTNTQIDVTPAASSPACQMSSTGSYVGAIACQGASGGGVKPWEDGGMPDGSLPSFGAPPGPEASSGCGCRLAAAPRSGSWLLLVAAAAGLLRRYNRRMRPGALGMLARFAALTVFCAVPADCGGTVQTKDTNTAVPDGGVADVAPEAPGAGGSGGAGVGGTGGVSPDAAPPANTIVLEPSSIQFFSLPINSLRAAVSGWDPKMNACATIIWDYSNNGMYPGAHCDDFKASFPYVHLVMNTTGPCGAWEYGGNVEFDAAKGCVDFGMFGPASVDLVDTVVQVHGSVFTGSIIASNLSLLDPKPVLFGIEYVSDVPEDVYVQSANDLGLPTWVRVTRGGAPVELFDRCDVPKCGEPSTVCGPAQHQVINITGHTHVGKVYLSWDGRERKLDASANCMLTEAAPAGDYEAQFCIGWSTEQSPMGTDVANPQCFTKGFSYPTDKVVYQVNNGG